MKSCVPLFGSPERPLRADEGRAERIMLALDMVSLVLSDAPPPPPPVSTTRRECYEQLLDVPHRLLSQR
jgi:hypothetical protein